MGEKPTLISRAMEKAPIAVASAGLLIGSLVLSGCKPGTTGLAANTILVRSGDVEITAGEYDAIVVRANQFNLPAKNLGMLGLCESSLQANKDNGVGFRGFFQQMKSAYPGRVANYEKQTGEDISNDIDNYDGNTAVSAHMIASKRNSAHSRSHNGLSTDWIECQRGWDGKDNKSHFWDEATLIALALASQEKVHAQSKENDFNTLSDTVITPITT